MKKLFVMLLVFTACNNSDTDSTPVDEMNNDQNGGTDTRTINPNDTTKQIDTGSYREMSDSLRNQ